MRLEIVDLGEGAGVILPPELLARLGTNAGASSMLARLTLASSSSRPIRISPDSVKKLAA